MYNGLTALLSRTMGTLLPEQEEEEEQQQQEPLAIISIMYIVK